MKPFPFTKEETVAEKWTIEGDYLQACSCDYGCPCEFEAPPTRGFCEGLGAWRIRKGSYGNVKLDGLGFGFVAKWPQAIHLGNGTVQLLFDEKATPEQRNALLTIASGAAGGMPFELIVKTFSKVLEPKYVPFEFEVKGQNSRAKMGNVASLRFEPIKNPVNGAPEKITINHATGFLFQGAEAVSNQECKAAAGELSFSWPDKAGFVAEIRYSN
jgi:hypothetical protein